MNSPPMAEKKERHGNTSDKDEESSSSCDAKVSNKIGLVEHEVGIEVAIEVGIEVPDSADRGGDENDEIGGIGDEDLSFETNEDGGLPVLSAWFRNVINTRREPGAFSVPGTTTNFEPDIDASEGADNSSRGIASVGLVIAYMVESPVVTPAIARPMETPNQGSSTDLRLSCRLLSFSTILTILLLATMFFEKKKTSFKGTCKDIEGLNKAVFDPVEWHQLGESIQGTYEFEDVGSSVSMCSNMKRIAIGSHAHLEQYAKIYDYINGTWTITFDFSESLPQSEYRKDDGSTTTEVSFSDDCKRLAIGIPTFDAYDKDHKYSFGLVDRGTFVVFEFTAASNKWTKIGDVNLESFPIYANVGHSITISGDGKRVATGKYHELKENKDILQGGITVFELTNSSTLNPTWERIFFQPVPVDFAISLDYHGTMLAVGSPSENSNKGQVHLYNISSGEKMQSFSGSEGDRLGETVMFSDKGRRLAIGTKLSTSIPKNDYVKIFEYESSTERWIQLGQDLCGKCIDFSFSKSGDYIAIGSYQDESRNGALLVYKLDDQLWRQVGNKVEVDAADSDSALSISLSENGEHVTFGASRLSALKGGNKGYVQTFEAEF